VRLHKRCVDKLSHTVGLFRFVFQCGTLLYLILVLPGGCVIKSGSIRPVKEKCLKKFTIIY